MNLKILKNIGIFKLLLLSSYIICWLSISTSFEDLLIFEENNLNIKSLINFFRHGLIYFFLFYLTISIFILRKKIDFGKYLIFYFFIAYLFAKIPGLFLTNNSIENISFVASSLTLIICIILINNFFQQKEKYFLLIISFVILNTVFFLTFTPLFWEFINGGNIFYGVHESSSAFFGKLAPRSSGLARTALIILILISIFEVTYFKKTLKKLIFPKIFFLTCILLFQGRTVIFLTTIVYIIILFNHEKLTLKYFCKFLLFYLFVPVSLFLLLSSLNLYKKSESEILKIKESNISVFEKMSATFDHLETSKGKILRKISKDNISSGRFDDWKEIISNISGTKIIYGYGAQGDRYLIDQTASNGIIYVFASSGLVGLIFFLIFSFLSLFKIIIVSFSYFKKDVSHILCCLIIFMIGLRSVLETSYAVFSIDLIVFLTILSFINEIKKLK